jgi:hypothetical protein
MARPSWRTCSSPFCPGSPRAGTCGCDLALSSSSSSRAAMIESRTDS